VAERYDRAMGLLGLKSWMLSLSRPMWATREPVGHGAAVTASFAGLPLMQPSAAAATDLSGFDFGLRRRRRAAMSDSDAAAADGAGAVNGKAGASRRRSAAINDWQPDALVVGVAISPRWRTA
jgi:hypothetical protein